MIQTLSLDELQIPIAADLLREGKLVVFPTETVYGLGANALSGSAVARIFEAKGRPQDNPLIVHIASLAELGTVAVEVDALARLLLERFCPGPMTVILKRHPALASVVSAGLPTVGVRIPGSPFARKFLAACAVPVAAPSANRSGRPSPTNFAMSWAEMNGRAEAILHGPDADEGLESTIIWPQDGRVVHILRPGAISPMMLRAALDAAGLLDVAIRQADYSVADANLPRAPGTRYRHYSPQAVVHLFSNMDELQVLIRDLAPVAADCALFADTNFGLLVGRNGEFMNALRFLRQFDSLREYSRGLYRNLVEADAAGCQHILAWLPPQDDIGLALRDRLLRAAGLHS